MMRKKLYYAELIGFVAVALLGTLGHFLYDWSGENALVAAFAAVNESTWEHMKLLFVPIFVYTMLQFTVFGEPFRNFFAAKAAALIAALLAIPALYYTLNGMFGKMPDWANISIFYLADALFFALSYFLLTRGKLRGGAAQLIGFVLFWLLMFAFVLFTYRTPALPLFQDPLTGQFGLAR